MATPALVVGVGGTGEGILSHLKRSLKQSHGGVMPPEVKLLHIDTDASQVADPATARREERHVVEGGELDPGESIKIGGNIRRLAEEIAAGQHPEFQWFLAEPYLARLPESMWYLYDGAGQYRQFGRMAFFYDIRQGSISVVRSRIQGALTSIQQHVGAPNIHAVLVGSLAGGTGAGMFVDVAHMVRAIGKQAGLDVDLRGVLLLPRTFVRTPAGYTDAMKARAAAAMRENERFTVNFKWATGYPMNYAEPGGPDQLLRNNIKVMLFDHLYYMDGVSPQKNLDRYLPREAHFPMVAEFVACILDHAEAGPVFQTHTRNVQKRREDAGLDKVPVCGAIGAYSIVLPVYHWVEEFSTRLGLETLDLLLRPLEREESAPDGVPVRLSPSENAEKGAGNLGRSAVTEFLATDTFPTPEGEQFQNTGFTQEVARVLQQYHADNPREVEALAGRGLGWLDPFTPTGNAPDIESLRERVGEIVNARVREHVSPPRVAGDKPAEAVDRVLGEYQEMELKHFGAATAAGTAAGGEYPKALQRYSEIHLDRFGRLLNLFVRRTLDGQATDPVEAKAGKLGYVEDFLDGVVTGLGTFHKLMGAVRTRRTLLKRTADARAALQGAETALRKDAYKKDTPVLVGVAVGSLVVGFALALTIMLVLGVAEAPALLLSLVAAIVLGAVGGAIANLTDLPYRTAHNAYERYLDRAEELLEQLRIDTLLHIIEEQSAQLKSQAEEARGRVRSWIETLANGRPHGLYRQVREARAAARNRRNEEERVREVRRLLRDEAYEEELYKEYVTLTGQGPSQAARELLAGFVWQLPEKGFDLRLAIRDGDTPKALGRSQAGGMEAQELGRRNREVFVSACRRVFAHLPRQVRMADYLINRKGHRPTEFAADLFQNLSSPLLGFNPAEAPNRFQANFLRIQAEGTEQDWCKEAVHEVAMRTGSDPGSISAVQSANPHILTLIFTTDLIPLKAVDEYRQGTNVYLGYSDPYTQRDRRVLHVFRAEENAVALEQRLGDLRREVRPIHNDVVLQLEYPERLRLFAQAWAEDFVRTAAIPDGTERYFALVLPQTTDRWGVRDAAGELQIHLSATKQVPELLEALETFNYREKDYRGADGRQGLQIPIPYQEVERLVQERRKLPPPSDKERRAQALRERIERNRRLLEERINPLLASENPQVTQDLGAVFFFQYRDEITVWQDELTKTL